jgi:hypothetical protein
MAAHRAKKLTGHPRIDSPPTIFHVEISISSRTLIQCSEMFIIAFYASLHTERCAEPQVYIRVSAYASNYSNYHSTHHRRIANAFLVYTHTQAGCRQMTG